MNINNEVEVVITSFNQKYMIYEAVRSLYGDGGMAVAVRIVSAHK